MSEINAIVENILTIPILFEEKGKSFSELVHDSGYLDASDEITIEALAAGLEKFPDYVEEWLQWSENKRTDSGWYFKLNDSSFYLIGHFPHNRGSNVKEFTNPYLAAATYIKYEIEEI